jgi:hypothetical protein
LIDIGGDNVWDDLEKRPRERDELIDIQRELRKLSEILGDIRNELTGFASFPKEQIKWNEAQRREMTERILLTLRDELGPLRVLDTIESRLTEICEDMIRRQHADPIISRLDQMLETLKSRSHGHFRAFLIFAGIVAILGSIRHWF